MTISNDDVLKQLPFVLENSNFSSLFGEKYSGKVRDCYVKGDTRYLVASDRLSCFDQCVTSVPFKGEVLTQLAAHWFRLITGLIPHHVIDVPDPQVMVVKNGRVIPVEVVVRGYLAGGGWREYLKSGSVSGLVLPDGMKEFQKLPQPIITPSTKAPKGEHDIPISSEEVIGRGLVSAGQWATITEYALTLFQLGSEQAKRQGLLLADTKFEFALFNDEVILVDEILTLDSSRYWLSDTYQSRLDSGLIPEMLDKEPVRRWLLDNGYTGVGEVPPFSDNYRCELARHYISSYEKITSQPFIGVGGNIVSRIEARFQ
jgi:phosphoribosylaminoimidazole-succinocarboxamide synthase